MDDSGYRGWSEEQLAEVIRGLPRRQPPPALRHRVLAQAGLRRAPRLRLRLAFAALILLLVLDLAAMRWQDAGMIAAPASAAAVARVQVDQDNDLLALVQETYRGRIWRLALGDQPARPESYFQLRNRILETVDVDRG
jgi:hypothetical protein